MQRVLLINDLHLLVYRFSLKSLFKYFYHCLDLCLGEYWLQDIVQLERQVVASGGGPPPANAYTINGHPGPNYNCSADGN
jgi:hypothetical protein